MPAGANFCWVFQGLQAKLTPQMAHRLAGLATFQHHGIHAVTDVMHIPTGLWTKALWGDSAATLQSNGKETTCWSSKPVSSRDAALDAHLREVPLILEHGQIVRRLVFERLTDPPPEA